MKQSARRIADGATIARQERLIETLTEVLDHSVSQLDAIIEDGIPADFREWRADLRTALAQARKEADAKPS